MYLCLRHYAPRPPLPVVFVSKPDPGVLAQIAGKNVWLLSGAYVVQDEPLLPGWRQVEMRGDPMAGTVALMEPDQRGMAVPAMRDRGATVQGKSDAAGRSRAHGRDAHATLQPRADALSPGGRPGSTITACP